MLTSFRYRVLRTSAGELMVVEAFFDDFGRLVTWTETAFSPISSGTLDDLSFELKKVVASLSEPVIDEPS